MAFANPRLGYDIIGDEIIDLLTLQANKADLNFGLAHSVKMIKKENPDSFPVPNTMMPAILVWFPRKREASNSFPAKSRRDAVLTVEITCLVFYTTTAGNSDIEVRKLADNVEAIIRMNPDTPTRCRIYPVNTNFDWGQKGTISVSVAVIELEINKNII